MKAPYTPSVLDRLIQQVEDLRNSALALERTFSDALQRIHPDYRDSARNFLHYLAVRRQDIRGLQQELHSLGLSSLGRMEAYVLATLNRVLLTLYRLNGRETDLDLEQLPQPDFHSGPRQLTQHSEALLGPVPEQRSVYVMVTMDSNTARDYGLVRDLVAAGMNVMRINCAKDNANQWQKMIRHLRQAETETGRRCRVLCDLAGPNPRTSPLQPGPQVIHWKPQRNDAGQVIRAARVWLSGDRSKPETAADALLPVDAALLQGVREGDEIRFEDTRQESHRLTITAVQQRGCWAETMETAYVTSDTPLQLYRDDRCIDAGKVGNVPPVEQAYKLAVGDWLIITADDKPHPLTIENEPSVEEPARIGCTLPEVIRDAKPGERIFFDDGKLEGVIRKVDSSQLTVEIISARKGVAKLKGYKGINLPDTQLDLPPLTAKDLKDLDFVARHADMVSLSFVRRVEDVEQLIAALGQRDARHLGIVLKIETQHAVAELPRLLLAALRSPPVGVMIARGDLGVELGFTRLAEIQEEILWLCEAAHVPVIWATQVLENLAKKGLPARGEVTDAAMAVQAECVMLNKGRHIVETVQFLEDVLQRMQDHHEKKQSLLRKLSIAEALSLAN